MYHFLYCIENLINGKIYVGKHSTIDLDDGYMGSGKRLKRAIKKHGVENFRKHILIECDSSEEALEFERIIVNEDFVNDENTYNIALGGSGGNLNDDARRRGGINTMTKLWNDVEFRKRSAQRRLIQNQERIGSKHRLESKQAIGRAIAITQLGERNSQFGTVWVSNIYLKCSKKIQKNEFDAYRCKGWSKGRKMKW